MRTIPSALGLLFVVFTLGGNVRGAELTPGNILVSGLSTNELTELTPAGVPVQTYTFPIVDDFTELRDIAVDGDGIVHAYNGTFTVEMQSLDPVVGTLSSQTFAGWSTVNNVSYGGIAVLGDSVFVTDMATAGAGAPQGIVRFSLAGDPPVRFATSAEYIDLTIGWNGLLYALRGGGDEIDVFDPASEMLLDTIELDFTLVIADVRSVAVDAAGTLYLAAWNGRLYAADADGNTLDSLATGFSNLTDLDLNASGVLLAGSWFGRVILSDVDLDSVTSFDSGTDFAIHVAFTEPLDLSVEPIEVLVDVKPGSDGNPVNLESASRARGKSPAAGGVLPVAILSTADFDAASINVESLALGDPELPGTAPPIKSSVEDVDDDGLNDLLLHFSIRALVESGAIDSDSAQLMLTGEMVGGEPTAGLDLVTIRP